MRFEEALASMRKHEGEVWECVILEDRCKVSDGEFLMRMGGKWEEAAISSVGIMLEWTRVEEKGGEE